MAQQNSSEEVDLGYLFKKMGNLFKKFIKLIFLVLAFFVKYIVAVVILIIIGVGIGYYLDKNAEEVYNNEEIVIPNFESVDYLYDKVAVLNAKIETQDTIYLKTILDTNYRKLNKIEIEPIVDIYNFATQSRENIEVFKTLFQNQELTNFVEDIVTSKYYKYHRLNFVITGKGDSQNIVESVLKDFNDNTHFNQYREVLNENLELHLFENLKMIEQVDSLIQSSISYSKAELPNQSINIKEGVDFSNLIFRKDALLDNRSTLLKKKEDQVKIIKDVGANYNIIDTEKIRIPSKIKFPIFLVVLFSLFFLIKRLYSKMKMIALEN